MTSLSRIVSVSWHRDIVVETIADLDTKNTSNATKESGDDVENKLIDNPSHKVTVQLEKEVETVEDEDIYYKFVDMDGEEYNKLIENPSVDTDPPFETVPACTSLCFEDLVLSESYLFLVPYIGFVLSDFPTLIHLCRFSFGFVSILFALERKYLVSIYFLFVKFFF